MPGLQADDTPTAHPAGIPAPELATPDPSPDGARSLTGREACDGAGVPAPSGAAIATTAAVGVTALAAGAVTYSLLRRFAF